MLRTASVICRPLALLERCQDPKDCAKSATFEGPPLPHDAYFDMLGYVVCGEQKDFRKIEGPRGLLGLAHRVVRDEGPGFWRCCLLIKPPRLESPATTDVAEMDSSAHSCESNTREI